MNRDVVVILWLGAALVGALACGRAVHHFSTMAALTRRNYRGLEVPTATGFAISLGILATGTYLALLHAISPKSDRFTESWSAAIFAISMVLGFSLLGMWDDLAGHGEERGWRAHLRAARHGRASSGVIKLFGGLGLAFVAAAAFGQGFWWTLARAAVIALGANLFNLFDIRPGRASKLFVVACVVFLVFGGMTAPIVAGALASTLAFLPYDLRERAMLGDTGANAMGALVGWAIVELSSHEWLLIALGVLALLNLAGDRPGLSRFIDGIGPLRALDRAGRAPE